MVQSRTPAVSRLKPPSRLLLRLPTSQVVVRPFVAADASRVSTAVAESMPELRRFLPWAHEDQSEESQRRRIAACMQAYWTGVSLEMGIFSAADGSCLGCAGMMPRTLNDRALEIGYWISSRHAGKGLATAVTRALIVLGFNGLDLERIQCLHNVENAASARVMDKCGFIVEGRLRWFDRSATPRMLQGGWAGGPDVIMRALVREDVPRLRWFSEVQSSLDIWDLHGEIVSPELWHRPV